MSPSVSRGFSRSRPATDDARLPPGQHLVEGFPVLSAGPTPHVPLDQWNLTVRAGNDTARRLTWPEFRELPSETITADIHCVTSWSKLDTVWEGVSVDTLLEGSGIDKPYVIAVCDGGYTTNLDVADVTGGRAWLAHAYGGEPLAPEHGGPVRLLVPHLYLWKSAKWVRELVFADENTPGFWESLGYHARGDPWREQRYSDD